MYVTFWCRQRLKNVTFWCRQCYFLVSSQRKNLVTMRVPSSERLERYYIKSNGREEKCHFLESGNVFTLSVSFPTMLKLPPTHSILSQALAQQATTSPSRRSSPPTHSYIYPSHVKPLRSPHKEKSLHLEALSMRQIVNSVLICVNTILLTCVNILRAFS